jgi:hypothetical protein
MGLTRIIIHHSAGTYQPNSLDRLHYHYLYGKNQVYNGNFKPTDNLNCTDGRYAAHTGGLNTGSIGCAFLANVGFKDYKHQGECPLLPQQLELGFKHMAGISKIYSIPIDPEFIMTHYEVGQKVLKGIIERNKLTEQNIGKIDIICIPGHPEIKPDECGDYIREKILWYYKKI